LFRSGSVYLYQFRSIFGTNMAQIFGRIRRRESEKWVAIINRFRWFSDYLTGRENRKTGSCIRHNCLFPPGLLVVGTRFPQTFICFRPLFEQRTGNTPPILLKLGNFVPIVDEHPKEDDPLIFGCPGNDQVLSFRAVSSGPMNNFFTNEASTGRIMYGVADMQNKNWRGNTQKPISTI
jgi:hypothetical protein